MIGHIRALPVSLVQKLASAAASDKGRSAVCPRFRKRRTPTLILFGCSVAFRARTRTDQSDRFPDSVANCVTSSRAFRGSGTAPAVPSGRKSKIRSLPGS